MQHVGQLEALRGTGRMPREMTDSYNKHGIMAGKLHGLKWQTVDFPNGMNGHVYGPISIRRNDLTTANWSRINDLWAAMQQGEEYQYTIYGDSAYIVLGYSHIKARHTSDPMPPRLVLENKCLSSCRETIEWDYGNVDTLWAGL
jgi:hypothetical protein